MRLARRERFAYDDFLYICQQARKKLGLHKPKKEKKLPKLLPENALRRFFREIQACGECSTKSSRSLQNLLCVFIKLTLVKLLPLVISDN